MTSSASEFEFIMANEMGYKGTYDCVDDTTETIARPPEEFTNEKHAGFRWSYNAEFGDEDDYCDDESDEHFLVRPSLRPTPVGKSDENASSSDKDSQTNDRLASYNHNNTNQCQHLRDVQGTATSKDKVTCWQTRCVELEFALQKFRDQAQTIRELLREKVRYLNIDLVSVIFQS